MRNKSEAPSCKRSAKTRAFKAGAEARGRQRHFLGKRARSARGAPSPKGLGGVAPAFGALTPRGAASWGVCRVCTGDGAKPHSRYWVGSSRQGGVAPLRGGAPARAPTHFAVMHRPILLKAFVKKVRNARARVTESQASASTRKNHTLRPRCHGMGCPRSHGDFTPIPRNLVRDPTGEFNGYAQIARCPRSHGEKRHASACFSV